MELGRTGPVVAGLLDGGGGRRKDEGEEDWRPCLEESVRLHLASDVPLAVFLSGGVDSSAMANLATRVLARIPDRHLHARLRGGGLR